MGSPPRRRSQAVAALLLASAVVAGLLVFWLGWRYDNKYTASRHPAAGGVTTLDTEKYSHRQLLHLLDGWEFYAGKLLSPEALASGAHTPDAVFYLGRYGGFDLGDAQASPYGRGTYRMVVRTGNPTGEYALELVQNYSRWQLWVDGQLRQGVGMDGPAPTGSMVTFFSGETVEIVVAVEDDQGLYSGMVYPPAFGSPASVGGLLVARLVLHSAFFAASFFIGVSCLVAGAGLRFNRRPYLEMFLLCLCYAGMTSWALTQAMGWYSVGFVLMERVCTYGFYLLMLWVVGRLCCLPKKILLAVGAVGILVCAAVLVQPLISVDKAGALYLFSALLDVWKWAVAVLLLGIATRTAHKGVLGSRALMWGGSLFATMLVADRMSTLYEPILFGWPLEWAGLMLIGIAAVVLWRDTVLVHRESQRLRQQSLLDAVQLEARRNYTELQQAYVRRVERTLHESRNRLAVIRYHAAEGEDEKIVEYVDRLLDTPETVEISYTGNGLLDALLSIQFERAQALDVYVEHEFRDIPLRLSMEDSDLTAVVMNLLDNALNACEEIPQAKERWVRCTMRYKGDCLTFRVENAASAQTSPPRPGHGHGQSIVREAAERYGGHLHTEQSEGCYIAEVRLCK